MRTEGDRLSTTAARLAEARQFAVAAGRPDLAERLEKALANRSDPAVAVVGEFKQGKSSLVNALLHTDVCPVDADVVTALPTILRFGRPPAAYLLGEADQREPIEFADLPKHITGTEADPAPRAVEAAIDSRLLGAGLAVVDTPGVGGLDSAQGNLTLATLTMAGAALFVTDAAQELTAPEVEFLRRTRERCPRTWLVLTKIDLHVEWRRIAAINEGHLKRAGLDVPVIPVSSFLRVRARARDDTALNDESGFPRLVELVRREIIDAAEDERTQAAEAELAFVIAQLRDRLDAEEAAADPRHVERYAERARRSAQLVTGTWQTVLGDGIQDLAADVDHDLRERLRLIIIRGEQLLAESDPRNTWQDFQAWAAREASRAAADNLMLLVSRAEQLARDVAERFGLEAHDLSATLPAVGPAVHKARDLELNFQKSTIQQFLGAFTAARVAYGGFFLLGGVGALVGVAWAAPLGLLAGVAFGRRLVKAEKERQVQQRRHQAGQELRRYVDEVGFHVGRDSREAVRRTQRHLRDEFAARARELSRSAASAEAAVREAASLTGEQRRARAATIAEQRDRLERLAG
ncbi:dynamin family protein [Actinoplanes sp. Pm04-4]|uniref:Dynamin family protein n=1 Tax=Paractinoplanes pyxinae TaxID=2997416 RepID=A0ABT4BAK3_9ACTN|nr:dynamin family protein [Actinoplanes pyxinae]MCY1143540.1 dynamin family protein [Actinoplanes pyxinae]